MDGLGGLYIAPGMLGVLSCLVLSVAKAVFE